MEKPVTDYELAWSGVGQHKDIITPIQLCLITSAIANDGVVMQPKLCLKVVDRNGKEIKGIESEEYKTILQ